MVKDKIKLLRKENDITQIELAEKIYVSRQTISRWENGSSIPSTDNIAQIAQFFEKDMSYFLPNYEYEKENTSMPPSDETPKIKAHITKYWKDICIFALALSPLLYIWFTPISTYSYMYARKNKKTYRTIIGLIVLTFSIYFLIQFILDMIALFGLGGTTIEVIME
ncbi:helix-turn-helix transcriptional regulator [Carnobacteriaceae bacterium 52-44]|jgi:Predicted transcriptional regulators